MRYDSGAEVVLDATRIDAGLEVARRLLDPVLQGASTGTVGSGAAILV